MASLFKKKNSSSWYANWRSGNKIKTRSTGVPIKGETINGMKETPSQARGRAQSVADGYEAAEKQGLHSARVKQVMDSLSHAVSTESPKTKTYLDDYLESRKGQISNATYLNSKRAIGLFVKFLKSRANLPLSEIKRSDAKNFINDQLMSVRLGTAKKYITSLSPAFMAALDEELIDRNPFHRLPLPRSTVHEHTEKEAFSIEEVKRMIDLLPDEWPSMVIFCLLLGGQRLGDIACLKWDQIDMRAGIVSLSTGKVKRRMRIPITENLKAHIESLERVTEYVHPKAAEKYNRNGASYLSYQFKTSLQANGIIPKQENQLKGRSRIVRPKTFHSLRATAATLLHSAGVDHALALEIVGHDSEKSHQLYIRPDDDQKRIALNKIDSLIFQHYLPQQKRKELAGFSDEV